MAKKKESKLNPIIKAELIGISLLVVSILFLFGIGKFSRILFSGFIFMFGTYAYFMFVILLITAIRIIIGRKASVYQISQYVGLGLFSLSVLVFISLLSNSMSMDLGEFFSNLLTDLKNYISTNDMLTVNGGIVGYLLTSLFVKLFNTTGTAIIMMAMFIASLILLLQKTIRDELSNAKSAVSTMKEKNSKKVKPPKHKLVKNDSESGSKKIKFYNFGDEEESQVEESLIEENPIEALLDENIDEEENEAVTYDDTLTEEIVEVEKQVVSAPKSKNYKLPPLTLLSDISMWDRESKESLDSKAEILKQTLNEFNVKANVVAVNVGPTVTQFEIEIQAGTKLSKVKNLSGELALALAAKDVRIQAPIPQKSTVGIEIPNNKSAVVGLKEIIRAIPKSEENKMTFALGKDIMGKPVYAALNKMPHLLVAGATGSGKSVCINSIIISMAMRAKPEEVKMLLIDPKKVELSGYNGLPHLLAPVVTNPKKAATALQKIVVEMERRYELFSDVSSKNIESYNDKLKAQNLHQSVLPYIMVIVDELADLMLVASKEVEDAIMRITQMSRAAGIHLIVATQRPSTDIITGVIKSNIPSRIAFAVSSSIDSRTILDATGAEKLLGKGDMLFAPMGTNNPIRIQGAFLSEAEVEAVVDYCASQQVAKFDETISNLEETSVSSSGSEDDLYPEVLEFVLENGSASTSLLQRRFRIGYNRASRLIDDLEANGVIGPANGSKPREVLE